MTKKDFERGRIDASKDSARKAGAIDRVMDLISGNPHNNSDKAESKKDYYDGWRYEKSKK